MGTLLIILGIVLGIYSLVRLVKPGKKWMKTRSVAFFGASFSFFLFIIGIVASVDDEERTAREVRLTEMKAQCSEASDDTVRILTSGLTGLDGPMRLKNVYVVSNNDRHWHFLGGAIQAPGVAGYPAVWATRAPVLHKDSLIYAADRSARQFSVWDYPGDGTLQFGVNFKDEIQAVRECAEGGL